MKLELTNAQRLQLLKYVNKDLSYAEQATSVSVVRLTKLYELKNKLTQK